MEIGQIAEELKLMANTGTKVPGFRRKVMVDIDRVMALSDEILQGVPEDIKEASEVMRRLLSLLLLRKNMKPRLTSRKFINLQSKKGRRLRSKRR